MLITGGLVYSLLQLPQIFERWYDLMIEGLPLDTKFVVVFVGLHLFSRALLLGFLTNLGLRTLWLAAIGINFTFPEGINYNKLNYSETFEEQSRKKTGQVQRIIALERMCSISFSLSIILGIFSIGVLICVYLFYLILDPVLPGDIYDSPGLGYTLFILLIIVGLGLFDRIFLGWLGQRQKTSKRYLFWSKGINFFNLSFLYKQEWFILISNIKRWVFYLIIILFLGIAGILAINEVGGYHQGPGFIHINPSTREPIKKIPTHYVMRYNNYFNQLEPGKRCYVGCISSDIVSSRYLWLFITYNYDYDVNF